MPNTSKTFKDIHIYPLKSREASRWIFYSSIIFLIKYPNIWWYIFQRLSRILKTNLLWMIVPTNDFSRQKYRTRRDNPTTIKPSRKTRKKPSKDHTKNISFIDFKRSKDRMCHILSSII